VGAAVVCRRYFGEACLAILAVEAVVGVRVAAGVVAVSEAVVAALAAVVVLEEVSVVVAILAGVALVAVGSGTDSASINGTPNNYG
jgi:hypothetical protein